MSQMMGTANHGRLGRRIGCKNATVSLNTELIQWRFDWRNAMAAGKKTQRREWTKEDVRTLKALAREGTKTTAIARKLKRTLSATHQKARALRVTLGGGRRKKRPR